MQPKPLHPKVVRKEK